MNDRAVPVKETIPPVTQEEVDAARAKIRDILVKAQEKSAISGKPLLIMVGEDHMSQHAALLEAVLYQEAKALGIKDVALELPVKPSSAQSKTITESMLAAPLARQTTIGMVITRHLAEDAGAQVHLVDGRHHLGIQAREAYYAKLQEKYGLDVPRNAPELKAFNLQEVVLLKERNDTIAANLTRLPDPTILITGEGHLKGLTRRMNKFDSHEIVSFDVSSPLLSAPGTHNPPAPIHRITLSGETRHLGVDQILTLAMGETEGKAFIEKSETALRKVSVPDVETVNEQSFEKLQKNPRDPKAMKLYALTLHEMGNDSAAGKAFAKLTVETEKSPKHVHTLSEQEDAATTRLFRTSEFNAAYDKEIRLHQRELDAIAEKQLPKAKPPASSKAVPTAPSPSASDHASAKLASPASKLKTAREENPFHELFAPLIKQWDALFAPDNPEKTSEKNAASHSAPVQKPHNAAKPAPRGRE